MSPAAALKSVVAQVVLDDLRLLAPRAESATSLGVVLSRDDALRVLMPTESGRVTRERLLSVTQLPVERELFPSLQLLLPEIDGFVPVTVRTVNKVSSSARTVLTGLCIGTLAHRELIRLRRDFVLARTLSRLPKTFAYLIHRATGGDYPLESWRLVEKSVSVESWTYLHDQKLGRLQ